MRHAPPANGTQGPFQACPNVQLPAGAFRPPYFRTLPNEANDMQSSSSKRDDRDVIDVEVVGQEENAGWRQDGAGQRSTYVHMTSSIAQANRDRSISTFVTFFLLFFCLFRWGFLAGLGFCFFMAIGTGIGIWHNMRCVLEGHKPEPWIARIATWTISMTLVACLV